LRANKLNFLQIPFFLFFQLLALRRIIKIEKINIIHAHWIIPQGLVAVVYKRLFHPKIKIICTSHGSDILGLKSLLTLPLKKYTLKNIDKLTVVSNLLKTEVSKMGVRPPIDILPMGVDLGRFGPDHRSVEIKRKYHIEGSFLIFVGRLSEEKGVKYLIEAMVAVVKEFPDTKLLIIGSGVLETELRNLSNNLNLSKNVIFTGYMQNASLPSYYATADILIGPSLREGFGLVFAEAMACGCPVIASDLPSVSEIIINGQTGLFNCSPIKVR
jgi:glycosyltransferase involved in cell wall biosynthesis